MSGCASGGCTCNGTIKSRRCSCQNNVTVNRDTTMCGNNDMFDKVPILDGTMDMADIYSSGMTRFDLDQITQFNSNSYRISALMKRGPDAFLYRRDPSVFAYRQ